MSGNSENPLDVIDQYTGKVFRLSSTAGSLDLNRLPDMLSGKRIFLDPPKEYQNEDIEVPEIFKTNGEVRIMTTVENVQRVSGGDLDIVTGDIILDETGSVMFRNQQVLLLDTESVQFVIFEYESIHYISLIAGRKLVDNVLKILGDDFEDENLSLTEILLSSSDIDKVADDLADELLNTTFQDYPQSSIDKKYISGRGYQNEPEYQEEKRRGAVRTHMMATEKLIDGSEKVVSLSEDALVRSYSNLALHTYLNMIRDYILPPISTQATVTDFQ